MYPYGLIGNCNISALISDTGSIDWLCLPRPDSPPVFGRLLDPRGGHFSISLIGQTTNEQRYVENTTILITTLSTAQGDSVRITDFCPRFEQYGRMFRPLVLFRKVERLSGTPVIQVEVKPVDGWLQTPLTQIRGNSHVKFNDTLRLATNMPLTYLASESAFQVQDVLYFAFGSNFPIEEDLVEISERFLRQTEIYWRTWVKHCSIPTLFQQQTIRSALTLKLHVFEDTGAILAALTTSLPEQIGATRNWDYRFCWLRDAYFTLSAFHNLGHFEETEGFLKYLLELAHQSEAQPDQPLAPVYTLDRALPLPETTHSLWAGYAGSQPVRSFNQAAEHVQNDVYGEMLLTLAPLFGDERFAHLRTRDHERLVGQLARAAFRTLNQPDAGLWEIRGGWRPHTFTHLMSWAGLDRAARMRSRGWLSEVDFDFESARDAAARAVLTGLHEGALSNGPGDSTADASLALAAVLNFPDPEMHKLTLDAIDAQLKATDGFYYRYQRADDFGSPHSAFVVCSFWMAQARARLGQREEATQLVRQALRSANKLGLFAEHFEPNSSRQLGNFPQAYSHVGLINSAFAVSPPWDTWL